MEFQFLFHRYNARPKESSGFSPPTIDEVCGRMKGSFNLDLEAEKGVNYELGVSISEKGKSIWQDFLRCLLFSKLDSDVTTFYPIPMSGTISKIAGRRRTKGNRRQQ